jgi:mono/diheme cytochrome c family protein
MRILAFAFSALAATLLFTLAPSASSASTAQVTHGKYIVTSVAMCINCHGTKLTGEKLPFKPTVPMNWQGKTPNLMVIARTVPANKLVRFLETGVYVDGTHSDPPMPQFRMSHGDAQAVVAYLRSLAGAK